MRTHAAPALAAALLAAALAACVCVLVGLGGTPRPVSLAAAAPIPALLHQVWIGDERRIPKAYHRYSKTWARRNPGMRIMRHTDDRRSRRFVAEHYPRFLPLYDGCERPVEKADLLRYMLVHYYGGFYADMDTSCVRSLEPLRHNMCVIGPEHPFEKSQYLQWFFGAAPGHPLMLEVLEEALRRHQGGEWKRMDPDEQVLHMTGPQAFTAAVRRVQARHPGSIQVQAPGALGMYNIHLLPPEYQEMAYLVHHFYGTWKKHWKREWINF